MVKIETLLDTKPDEIAKESQFVLKCDHGKCWKLAQYNIHNKMYWVVAMEAAIIAGQRTSAAGASLKRMYNKHRVHMTRKAQLGISEAEERTRLNRLTYGSNNKEQPTGLFCSQAAIKPLSRC